MISVITKFLITEIINHKQIGDDVLENYGEILIYQTEDGLTKIDVNMQNVIWVDSVCSICPIVTCNRVYESNI